MQTTYCRSREGAWIEIAPTLQEGYVSVVAPVRERGLKLKLVSVMELKRLSRSREGAWIEIRCRIA